MDRTKDMCTPNDLRVLFREMNGVYCSFCGN